MFTPEEEDRLYTLILGHFDVTKQNRINSLAQQYEDECEAYDRTVCPGGHPRDGSDLAKINIHAKGVMYKVWGQAQMEGITRAELLQAIRELIR